MSCASSDDISPVLIHMTDAVYEHSGNRQIAWWLADDNNGDDDDDDDDDAVSLS